MRDHKRYFSAGKTKPGCSRRLINVAYFKREILHHSRIPISRTSKGNENWFEKSGGLKNWGENYREFISKGNENWFEKSGGLRNRGFEKSGFHEPNTEHDFSNP